MTAIGFGKRSAERRQHPMGSIFGKRPNGGAPETAPAAEPAVVAEGAGQQATPAQDAISDAALAIGSYLIEQLGEDHDLEHETLVTVLAALAGETALTWACKTDKVPLPPARLARARRPRRPAHLRRREPQRGLHLANRAKGRA